MPKDLVINNGKLDTSKLIGAPNVRDINYILNADAEVDLSGWTTYADAAQALPVDGTGGTAQTDLWIRSTTTPLRGTGSFRLDKTGSATRQGQGVAYDFSIDKADQAKVLSISFDMEVVSGTYASGDVTVYIYDVTNAQVIQPAGFQVQNVASGIENKVIATFQTSSNSTSYRLLLHIATASTQNYTLAIDNVVVGPQSVQFGAPVTDWVSYTPTGTWTANTTYTGQYRRVGDSLELSVNLALTGAPNSTTLTVNLPPGLSVDSTKLANSSASRNVRGHGVCNNGLVQNTLIPRLNGNTIELAVLGQAQTYIDQPVFVTQAIPFTFASGHFVTLYVSGIPITGWSSSLQLSDSTDTRVVAAIYSGNGGQTITANVTDIPWSTKVQDTHGAWNGTTFTAPVPGFYQFQGSFRFNANALPNLSIYKNGTLAVQLNNNGLNIQTQNMTGMVFLNAGDTATIRASVGGTLLNDSVTHNLQIFRLSGPSVIAATESVSARVFGVTTTGFSNTNVNWLPTSKSFDSHNSFNLTNGIFSCPTPGKYRVTVSNRTNNSQAFTAGIGISTSLFKNNVFHSVAANMKPWATITPAQGAYLTGSSIVDCVAGDQLDLRIAAESAGTYNLLSNAADATLNWITFERIGN